METSLPNSISRTIYADKIFYYQNVITNPNALLLAIEANHGDLISNWSPWSASDDPNVLFGAKKSTKPENYDHASKAEKAIYDQLLSALTATASDYADTLDVPVGKQAPISISKYFVDAFMGPHTDSPPMPTIEHISSVMYLNDNYVGGEIHFPNQGITIKPTAGSIVVFPSIPPFLHESKKIVSGTKYMSPAFWFLTD